MTFNNAVEHLLRRDRVIVTAGLIAVIVLAWAYLVYQLGDMISANAPVMDSDRVMMMGADAGRTSGVNDGLFTFAMWSVMMVAMMTPSAAPIILLYTRVCRKRGLGGPIVPTAFFYLGYIAVWTAFSGGAALLQWKLQQSELISSMMVSTSPILTAGLLIVAGLYQWMPAKRACLTHCRSPVEFLSRHWQAGRWGAFRMGVRHGGYCLGCCWAFMLLLFVGGVMNLLWVAIIAAVILVEKIAPFGRLAGRVGGVGIILLGFAQLVVAVF